MLGPYGPLLDHLSVKDLLIYNLKQANVTRQNIKPKAKRGLGEAEQVAGERAFRYNNVYIEQNKQTMDTIV